MNQNSPDICATVCILLELDMCNACWVSEDYTLIQMAFGSYGDLIGHLLWLSQCRKVCNFLLGQGIPEKIFELQMLGDENPLAS